MPEIPAWVQQTLDEVQAKDLTELDLSLDFGSSLSTLTFIPPQVFTFRQLISLRLSHSKLQDLPPEFSQLTNLITLDLPQNELKTLPEAIGELTNLTTLNLFRNSLKTLPEAIGRLTKLRTLNLSRNSLKTLPEAIGRLTKLRTLNLSWNGLMTLPEVVTQLTNLSTLDLSWNGLMTLPEVVTQLTNLTILNLVGNRIMMLPKEITGLKNLTTLDLSRNNLTTLPKGIGGLSNLSTLNLSGNDLKTLPEWIGELTNLSTLNLSGNDLTTLPKGIGGLSNLSTLNLSGNDLTTLPETILELRALKTLLMDLAVLEFPPPEAVRGEEDNEISVEKLRQFFTRLKREGEDHLYEAKLLILGEGGAGKTSLAKKLLDQSYQLEHEESSTEGINVHPWAFPIDAKKPMQVSIWDFGGQEIYHATHQFFLTKRSLYVLVADSRKEDTDFYYWLNVVELLSDGSPVIIIKNEKQDRQKDIGDAQLKARFSNIKDILATNLASKRGLNEVVREIKYRISTLPHIGTPLPKTWVQVREALERDPRNYILVDEYGIFCEQAGIAQPELRTQVIDFLHDLGICLHFREDRILKHYVILKSKWGTDAVYRVLDNKTVVNNLGRFTLGDLDIIWSDEEYIGMRDALLQLMINFQLCYEIPHNPNVYIAPQLLAASQPKYDWDNSDSTILKYTYSFMPKGIITRFIVAVHRLIENQTVWKTGVVISNSYARGEIIEAYDRREIQIQLNGPQKKMLLGFIVEELDAIHASFPRLDYKKLIPCNCSVCRSRAVPHFFPYDYLLRSEGLRERVHCMESYQMIDPRSLLENVLDPIALEKELWSESLRSGRTPFNIMMDLLIEHCSIEKNRDALVTMAFQGDSDLRKKIDYTGSAQVFASHLYNILQAHGEVRPGRRALWQFLLTLRAQVGDDQQEVIDSLKSWANAPR